MLLTIVYVYVKSHVTVYGDNQTVNVLTQVLEVLSELMVVLSGICLMSCWEPMNKIDVIGI